MTMLFCDGFDHYDKDQVVLKWDYFGGSFYGPGDICESVGRFGTNCISLTDSWTHFRKALPARDTLIIGFAFMMPELPPFGYYLLKFVDSATNTTVAGLVINGGGKLELWGGLGSSTENFGNIATSDIVVRAGYWQYIEIKITFSPTAGTAIVKVQETEVLNVTSQDFGGDYTDEAITTCDILYVGGNMPGMRTDWLRYFDDFYICDDNGSQCNDFLGDCRICEMLPTVDGFYKDWGRSAGADGYPLVDDAYNALDGNATFVYSKTVNNKDTYGFPDLPMTDGDVKAVCMNYYMSKYDSGVRKLKGLSRLGGVNGLGNELTIGVGYAVYQSFMEKDPNNSSWTISNVNVAEFGQELTV